MNSDAVRCRLASLIGRRVSLFIEDGVLRARGPRNALTADDLAWLTSYKEAISEMITAADADTVARVWWNDPGCNLSVIWVPDQSQCIAPIACSRFGPCQGRIPGVTCDVTKRTQLEQEAA